MVLFLDNITLYDINSCCYVFTLHSDIDDLVDVKRELISIADKWKDIGLALRLKPATLNTIEGSRINLKDRLSDVLAEWLNKAYNVQRFGQPSWQLVVRAVRDPAGGDNQALADTMAAKYGGKGSLFTSKGCDYVCPLQVSEVTPTQLKPRPLNWRHN